MKKLTHLGASFLLAPLFCSILISACGRSQTATLALLGDLSLGRDVHPSIDSLAYIGKEIASADLALANLESPLSKFQPDSDGFYNLCADAPYAGLIAEWGLDFLTLANNHSLDCSSLGLEETTSILQQAGLTSFTNGYKSVIVAINGVHLAFLAFDDVSSALDIKAAALAVQNAHQQGNLVVISIHWGLEYQAGISERQQYLASRLVEAGASLVWGHHPHVLQSAAFIQPEDASLPPSLVLFSLGNTLFDQAGLPSTRQSALVLVTLKDHGVVSYKAVPFEIDIHESCLVKPEPATSKAILEHLDLP